MKKFTLKTKARGCIETVTFPVDDDDAPMVRTHVWFAKWDKKSKMWQIGRVDVNDAMLQRLVMRPSNDCVVCHRGDDPLDFRKENLVVMTKAQWKMTCARHMNFVNASARHE